MSSIKAEVGTALDAFESTVDGTVFNSNDVTPTAGRVVILVVAQSGTAVAVPTISGTGWASGLTWTQAASVAQGTNTRVTAWWAICPASPTSGHVIVTAATTQTSCQGSLFDLTNAHLGNPIGATGTGNGGGATSGSATIGGVNAARSVVGAFRHTAAETSTAGTGSLVGTPTSGATPNHALGVEFADVAVSPVTMSWTSSVAWAGIAFEIIPTLNVDVGYGSEADTAKAILTQKRVTVAFGSEADGAQATTPQKQVRFGKVPSVGTDWAPEADTAQAVGAARSAGTAGWGVEADSAQAVGAHSAAAGAGWGLEPWGLFPWGDPVEGEAAQSPRPQPGRILGPGPSDELWAKVTSPTGRVDFPPFVESLEIDESAPGGFMGMQGEIELARAMDLREVYADGSVIEVFSQTGLMKFYGHLQTPSPSRSRGVAVLKADGCGRDAEMRGGRLLFASADPGLWIPRNSSGYGPNGNGYYVQGEESFQLDNRAHLQVTVAKASDLADKDQQGWIQWAPNPGDRRAGWRFLSAHVHVNISGSAYEIRISTANGPDGGMVLRDTITVPSGGSFEKDFTTVLAGVDDLINLELYRNGGDSSTPKAVQVTFTQLVVGVLADSAEMPVEAIVREVGGRLGWDTRLVMAHGLNALPFDLQQGSHAGALDMMALLVDWRWLALAVRDLGPVLDFGPWDRRVWAAVDPEWEFDPIPLPRFDSVVVPCRLSDGSPSEARGYAPGRLPRSREFSGISLEDPLPGIEPARAMAEALAALLFTERHAGTMELTQVTDASGGRWPSTVLHAGDTLITEVGPLRVKDLTERQSSTERLCTVTFDDGLAAADRMMARRSQRLRAQGLIG